MRHLYRCDIAYCIDVTCNNSHLLTNSFINFEVSQRLGLDFTALTRLCFSVALYMYILAL